MNLRKTMTFLKMNMMISRDGLKTNRLPPLVKGMPVFGNVLDIKKEGLDFFVKNYKKLGPAYRVRFFNRSLVVLAGPESNELLSKNKDLFRSKEMWSGVEKEFGVSKFLNGQDGDTHTKMRANVREGYSQKCLVPRIEELNKLVHTMVLEDWKPGHHIPAMESVNRIVSAELGTLMLNQVIDDDSLNSVRFFLQRLMTTTVTKQAPKFLLYMPSYKKAKKSFFDLGRMTIENYVPDKERPSLFIDNLLKASKIDPEFLPSSDLLTTVLAPYIGGMDTMTNTIVAAMYEVIKQPKLLERLQSEADIVFNDQNIPTVREINNNCPVANALVQEVLRVYPIVMVTPRVAEREFSFHGYTINKDQKVLFANTVTHFLENYYTDPLVFNIDRYIDDSMKHTNRGGFTSFGIGPHTCPAQKLASTLSALTLLILFYRLDLCLEHPCYKLKMNQDPLYGPDKAFKILVNGHRK